MRRVLACGRAMVVRPVFGGKGVVVVVHVDVGRRSGRYRDGARRSYRHSNECKRKNEVSQGAKQAHGREANDAFDPSQPLDGSIARQKP